MRYGIVVFFSMALLVGAGALVVLANRAWLALPLTGLVLLEAAIFPYPTLEFRAPPVYDQIAQVAGDFSVLEIPSFNWRYAAKNEVYQAIHQKRILRAYTNRIAPDLADYFNLRQTPIVIRSLRILEGEEKGILTQAERAQDRVALDDTLNFFNVRYAVLHRDQLSAQRVTELDAYIRDVMKGKVFYQDDTVTGYQFNLVPSTATTLELDFTDNSGLMYLGRGWQMEPLANVDSGQGRFLKAPSSEVYLDPRFKTLDVRLYSEHAAQTLQVSGGKQFDLSQGWSNYTFSVPTPAQALSRLLPIYLNQFAPDKSIATESINLK